MKIARGVIGENSLRNLNARRLMRCV